MKKIQKMTRAYFLFMTSAILGIACVLFNLPMSFRLFTVVMVGISIKEILKYSYCHNCEKYGIRIQPFLEENPRCKKCGKQV